MFKILFKIYFWIIEVPLFAILTILTALTAAFGCMVGSKRIFSYYPGSIWARLACILTLCPVKITGRENIIKGKPYIIASNHQSVFDIFTIYGYIGVPLLFMMKKSLGKIPLVGFACKKCGFVFVDKSSVRTAFQSIKEAETKLLSGNKSLIVFPEGSRTRDGKMNKFKRGAFQIAVDSKIAVLPVTLNGPYYIMKGNSWDIFPHRIEMIIHHPVMPPENIIDDKEKMQYLANETHSAIYQSLEKKFQ
ncbi:MAG: 1-acyl-sn-glycerol-3-phosphate acyltransferase [Tannerella sp.]|jgi:1-acyl-sn-glycerol-3-phosphate acyltransferase|nr:1-acyl-sn-glycerol-3-phosphate acyltransferase [Tannerella sp.]